MPRDRNRGIGLLVGMLLLGAAAALAQESTTPEIIRLPEIWGTVPSTSPGGSAVRGRGSR